MNRTILALLAVAVLTGPLSAQESAYPEAREELAEMNQIEQERFISGDCEGLLDLLAEDISFYANGRKLPKMAVGQMCARIPRP